MGHITKIAGRLELERKEKDRQKGEKIKRKIGRESCGIFSVEELLLILREVYGVSSVRSLNINKLHEIEKILKKAREKATL